MTRTGMNLAQKALMTTTATIVAASSAPALAQTQADSAQPSADIIVTAQKRDELLKDVPVPVTVLKTDTLVGSNKSSLKDYFSAVPGLALVPFETNGAASIAIRGVTTGGFTNPTVGITIDDVPFGSSTSLGGGTPSLDLDPSDLASIEVLRGPQGTLYGASSIGGLLKYTTTVPSVTELSGRIEGGINATSHSGDMGYIVRGAVNIPVSDTMAIRATAFSRYDGGYIDNVLSGEKDVNDSKAYGGRISALLNLSDTFSIRASALYQRTKTGALDEEHTAAPYNLAAREQAVVKDVGIGVREVQAYSLTMNLDLDKIQLTSLTGYSVNDLRDSFDYSFYLNFYSQSAFGLDGAPLVERYLTKKFTEELRVATQIGDFLDWRLGAFFTHENSPDWQRIDASDPVTGTVGGELALFDWKTTYEEVAAFSDVTVKFSPVFDIQFGARQSWIKQSYYEEDSGPYAADVLSE